MQQELPAQQGEPGKQQSEPGKQQELDLANAPAHTAPATLEATATTRVANTFTRMKHLRFG